MDHPWDEITQIIAGGAPPGGSRLGVPTNRCLGSLQAYLGWGRQSAPGRTPVH